MKNRKRKYIWASLLLAGVLSMPGKAMGWAEEDTGDFGDLSSEMLSDDEKKEVEIFQNEPDIWEDSASDKTEANEMVPEDGIPGIENEVPEILSENKVPEILSENEIPEILSENETSQILSQNTAPEILPKNEIDGASGLSGNCLSANFVEQEENKVSENKLVNVVLPTEIPFGIIFWGEEKREAWIKSEQYCIENRGYDDVCISIQGIVSSVGNTEDYAVIGSTTEEVFIQDKKNVWMYLKWEDEEREEIERPRIQMGDALNPGEGEIVLKAPKRNEEGEIIEENLDSKAYFSFAGDMKSDMDQGWESEELKISLNFFVNEPKDEEQNIEIPKAEDVSDNLYNVEANLF